MTAITTPQGQYQRLLDSNDASGAALSYPSPEVWSPSRAGVFDPGRMNSLVIVPFGTDTADQVFDLRIVGWSPAQVGNVEAVPIELVTVQCTLCTVTGHADGLGSDQHYCDEITYQSGDSDVKIISPGSNRVAWFVVDFLGVQLAEAIFGTDGTAASANLVYRSI